MKAIISVSDKTGVVDFARGLAELGVELYSTGGTKRALEAAGVSVAPVYDLTGFSEILDGRVKTLHPAVHAGILATRGEPQHMAQMEERGLALIDLVVVNLYPFAATVARPDTGLQEAIENIDIGGPTMIRAAAKNHAGVVVVVNPGDYSRVLDELARGVVSDATRLELAELAFAHTAAYDAAISAYLGGRHHDGSWPREFTLGGTKVADLRYGENPHQTAALYSTSTAGGGVAHARQLQGIELSYNNIVDADAGWLLVQDLAPPAVAIIKHTNPCGCAVAGTAVEAYRRAYECDPVSAFGGIVALNSECDRETAESITAIFVEAVVAPSFSANALEVLGAKPKVRVLEVAASASGPQVKAVTGGFLVQGPDVLRVSRGLMRSAGSREPSPEEWEQLLFAWTVVKHVKSNAIVLAREGMAVGVGAGQMSRVEAVQLAALRAAERARGTVLASDAFFPMPDGVEAAAEAG